MRGKILLFFAVLKILLIGLVAVLGEMLNDSKLLTELQIHRFQSRRLGEELRRSSDDLSRMARTYVVTEQPRYLKYFKRIAAIRDGKTLRPEHYQDIYWDFVTADHRPNITGSRKISIIDLMKEHGLSKDELSLLSEAKQLSDDLIKIEMQAFNAIKGVFKGPDGSYSLKGSPDKKLAQRLLFDSGYHLAKSKIMIKINEFFRLLNKRTLHEVRQKEERRNLLLMLDITRSSPLLGQGIIGNYLFRRKDITRPLNQIVGWAKKIKSRNTDLTPCISRRMNSASWFGP